MKNIFLLLALIPGMVIWRRTTDNISGDVLVKDVGIHFQVDRMGSPNEY